jgi:hypothetical protein
LQDGDVIELCQVSDIRAGGLPKVCVLSFITLEYTVTQKESDCEIEELFVMWI